MGTRGKGRCNTQGSGTDAPPHPEVPRNSSPRGGRKNKERKRGGGRKETVHAPVDRVDSMAPMDSVPSSTSAGVPPQEEDLDAILSKVYAPQTLNEIEEKIVAAIKASPADGKTLEEIMGLPALGEHHRDEIRLTLGHLVDANHIDRVAGDGDQRYLVGTSSPTFAPRRGRILPHRTTPHWEDEKEWSIKSLVEEIRRRQGGLGAAAKGPVTLRVPRKCERTALILALEQSDHLLYGGNPVWYWCIQPPPRGGARARTDKSWSQTDGLRLLACIFSSEFLDVLMTTSGKCCASRTVGMEQRSC